MGKEQTEENQNSSESKSKKRERSPNEAEEKKLYSKLNLNDLGAGYNQEEKRVARAIQCYQDQLIPFVLENEKMFAKSGFLNIKGYGTNIKDTNLTSHRSSSIDHGDQERDRSRYKRPRYST